MKLRILLEIPWFNADQMFLFQFQEDFEFLVERLNWLFCIEFVPSQ